MLVNIEMPKYNSSYIQNNASQNEIISNREIVSTVKFSIGDDKPDYIKTFKLVPLKGNIAQVIEIDNFDPKAKKVKIKEITMTENKHNITPTARNYNKYTNIFILIDIRIGKSNGKKEKKK